MDAVHAPSAISVMTSSHSTSVATQALPTSTRKAMRRWIKGYLPNVNVYNLLKVLTIESVKQHLLCE